MNALAPVAPKLGKLIPRLASGHDGEVVATVRAIERTLVAAGLDFHALAAAVGGDDAFDEEPQSWRDLARWCRDNDAGLLRSAERAFVRDMADRLVFAGEPSVKQAKWLRGIYARLRSGGAR